jgi:hypothetical protein
MDRTAACAFCGKMIHLLDGRVGRLEDCPSCGKYLHCCMQCGFYDRSYHNQCRENQAPLVSDKENANFCEFFNFGRDVAKEKQDIDDAMKKLEGLFGRKDRS